MSICKGVARTKIHTDRRAGRRARGREFAISLYILEKEQNKTTDRTEKGGGGGGRDVRSEARVKQLSIHFGYRRCNRVARKSVYLSYSRETDYVAASRVRFRVTGASCITRRYCYKYPRINTICDTRYKKYAGSTTEAMRNTRQGVLLVGVAQDYAKKFAAAAPNQYFRSTRRRGKYIYADVTIYITRRYKRNMVFNGKKRLERPGKR